MKYIRLFVWLYIINIFNAESMSIEDLKTLASNYKYTTQFSSSSVKKVKLDDAIITAETNTTPENILVLEKILADSHSKDSIFLLETALLYSFSLKGIYEISSEQLMLIKELKAKKEDNLLSSLSFYKNLDSYNACYSIYMVQLPVINSDDKKKIIDILNSEKVRDLIKNTKNKIGIFFKEKIENMNKY